jgi:hypothetical protein
MRHRLAAWIHLAGELLAALEAADLRMTTAGMDTRLRVNLYRQGRQQEWEAAVGARPDVLTRGHLWDTQNATYLVVMVVAQIEKARSLLPGDGIPGYPDPRDVRLWRNVLEHWEDDAGPSLTRLLDLEPGYDSSTIHYGGSQTAIGHLSTDRVRAWLDSVLTAIEEASVRDGQRVPRADDPVYGEPERDSE